MNELYIPNLSIPPEIKTWLTNFSRKYILTREVTKGANGYLFFGKNRVLNTDIAIKIYYWGNDRTFHAEPQNLAQINSPNVLSVSDAGYLDDRWAYFVTPFCSGGDLDDLLERSEIGNLKALNLVANILTGLSHLHAQRLLHRDIKPSNVYLNEIGDAVIGDFGSIKKVPEGDLSIPASSHALIYRPPESIGINEYGFRGDIYQTGITLYQLLGGYLPYDPKAWLSESELTQYDSFQNDADRSIFADQCIHVQIKRGKVIDLSTLPPWVCNSLRGVIRKACHVNKESRFESAAHFIAKLNEIRVTVPDWQIIDGYPTLIASTSYRVITTLTGHQVQKRRGVAGWRNDSSISKPTLAEVIKAINDKL